MLANIFGDWYWLVLVVIVLFGGSQLPKLARNSGEALKEFKKAHDEATGKAPSVGPAAGQTALTGTANTAAPAYQQAEAPRVVVPVAQVVPPTAEERITLSRAELDALLAAREAQVKADETGGTKPQA
jgi:sec-independent protein translocase protein TatA